MLYLCDINKEKNMPRRRTSLKRKRADRKKRLQNLKIKQQLKKTIKKFIGTVSAKNINEAKALLGKVFSQLDKAAKKRVIHPRTSDRRKSRLMKRLSRLA
jgi:small subunit ribosomal protein S20